MKSLVVKRSFAFFVLLLLSATRASAQTLQGAFASPERTPRVHARMQLVSAGSLKTDLSLAFYARDGERIRTYDTEMRSPLHLVVVSDDLRTTFAHLHPMLDGAGFFHLTLAVLKPGLYHLYADATPHGLEAQAFRFDATLGNVYVPKSPRILTPSSHAVVVGPYTVTLNAYALNARRTTTLIARIVKNGKPAEDLRPYLGMPAHAILINARDLSYLHVHALSADTPPGKMHDMQMPQTTLVDPSLVMHVRVDQADTYAFWLQFRGGGEIYAAPFVLIAHEPITSNTRKPNPLKRLAH